MNKFAGKLYIVLHHEIFDGGRVDEMVFFVASSLEKAIVMIKESYVSTYSWWEIQSYELDTLEWPEHVGWYGRKGGKLKKPPPFHKALEAYKKEHKNGSS